MIPANHNSGRSAATPVIARRRLAAVAIQKLAPSFRLLVCFGALPLAMTPKGIL